MKTFLISYDLIAPGRSYQPLYDYMKEYGYRAKPLQTVYLVNTNKSAVEIRDELKALVDTNDKVMVVEISTSVWATYNLQTTADWLNAY